MCRRPEEFYDPVVSGCSQCRDVCGRRFESNIYCIRNCPDYYRIHIQPELLVTQPTWSSPLSRSSNIAVMHGFNVGLSLYNAALSTPMTVTGTETVPAPPVKTIQEVLMTKPLFWISVVSILIALSTTVLMIVMCCLRYKNGTGRNYCFMSSFPAVRQQGGEESFSKSSGGGGGACSGDDQFWSNHSHRSSKSLSPNCPASRLQAMTVPDSFLETENHHHPHHQHQQRDVSASFSFRQEEMATLNTSTSTATVQLPRVHIPSDCIEPRPSAVFCARSKPLEPQLTTDNDIQHSTVDRNRKQWAEPIARTKLDSTLVPSNQLVTEDSCAENMSSLLVVPNIHGPSWRQQTRLTDVSRATYGVNVRFTPTKGLRHNNALYDRVRLSLHSLE